MDSDCEFPEYLTQDDAALEGSSSLVSYTNLVGASHSKAKILRREPSGLIDCHRVPTAFGHSEYKGKQREIVEAAVRGADIFVLAPTGMGKSLCFQVPAVAETHGVTIVVSPLLEVSGLREKHVAVASLTSETSATDKTDIIRDLASGHPVNRLLYITPEKLCTADFMKMLSKIYEQGELNRLVIDEEWGHDFRSEYRRLGVFRQKFEDIPIMALTATATPAVQLDIIRSLGMSEAHLVKVTHPFNRANLFYEVRYMSAPNPASQMADISDYIFTLYQRRERPSSGIVYCRTRAVCDELSGFLRGKGLNSRPLPPRSSTLKEWTCGGTGNGGVDLVCATIAFGLGIDKVRARLILIWNPIFYPVMVTLTRKPPGYYQETGRAGRDGSPSKCILYYSREDVIRVKRWVSGSHTKRANAADKADGPAPSQRAVDSLTSLVQFAESIDICRHVAICRYFGEPIDMADKAVVRKYCNEMCDVRLYAKYPEKTKRRQAKLSSEEYAGSQVPVHVSHGHDDDDYPPRAGPSRANSSNYNDTAVWTKNFRNGEIEPNYKRPREQKDQAGQYKKSKVASSSTPSYGKALVTKPFRSVTDLKKPFKTPFRGPAAAEPGPELEVDDREASSAVPDEDDSEPEVQVVDLTNSRPCTFVFRCDSSPYSKLFQPPLRHTALDVIRKALHKAFLRGPDIEEMWMRLGAGASADAEERASLLNTASHSLEFTALSMCSTADGYESRTEGTVEAVRFLGKNFSACDSEVAQNEDEEEWEDALAVLVVLREVCGRN
ncbi:ATP-dependent DNA helicase [Mycena vulgaris]|nr:ATP-dependent DNA helicase [Mycena vulgaris]